MKRRFATFWPLGLILLAACGPAAAPASAPASKPAPAAPPASAAASKPAAASASAKPAASAAASAKPAASASAKPAAGGEDLNALYEAAKKEGEVVFYGSLNTEEATPILKAFADRYPGVKTTNVRAPSEQIVQKFMTEAKAGKVLADVMETNAQDYLPLIKENLMAPWRPPEAAALSDDLKDKNDLWFGVRVNEIVIQCNTDKVPSADCKKLNYEALADPKWKDQMLIEQDDAVLLQTLAKHKYMSDDKALAVLKGIAANNPQVQKGHTETAELLVGGKRSLFVSAYLHRVFALQDKKAPTDFAPNEAVVLPILTGTPKGAPHPNAAKLLENWMMSKEGATVAAKVNRAPARRDVETPHPFYPPEMKLYSFVPDDVADASKYDKLWHDTLGVR
jgi:iron(III) transport system substrate-binding protein